MLVRGPIPVGLVLVGSGPVVRWEIAQGVLNPVEEMPHDRGVGVRLLAMPEIGVEKPPLSKTPNPGNGHLPLRRSISV
ncbi:MAG: hypothetical protein RL648_1034, partial [Verrucomicrobiota bacterium]